MKNEDFRKDRGDGELLKREYLRKLLLRQMIICASKMALHMQLVCTFSCYRVHLRNHANKGNEILNLLL